MLLATSLSDGKRNLIMKWSTTPIRYLNSPTPPHALLLVAKVHLDTDSACACNSMQFLTNTSTFSAIIILWAYTVFSNNPVVGRGIIRGREIYT